MTKSKGIFMKASDIKHPTNTFKLQEFYLDCTYTNEFGDRYENILKLQANNDNVNLLSGLKKGDRIEVEYNVKGKFSTNAEGKVFHNQNLVIKNLQKFENNYTAPPAQQIPVQNTPPAQIEPEDEDDGLPF